MAMVVAIAYLNSTGPTVTDIGATTAVWNRVDTLTGTTVVPTPTSTGTHFSYVKVMQIDITTTNSLSMSAAKVEKVASEATTGTKLWHRTDHAVGSYVQSTAAPADTGDNNSTAPVIPAGGNNTNVIAVPGLGAGSTYAAGPFSTTGQKGNLVEMCLGVDATNTTAGAAVSTPTLRWTWTES